MRRSSTDQGALKHRDRFNANGRTFANEKPGQVGRSPCGDSGLADIRSLFAFGALYNVELYFLTLFQGFEPVGLNRTEVREKILAPFVRRDEAKTFGVIEPLDRPRCHTNVFLQ